MMFDFAIDTWTDFWHYSKQGKLSEKMWHIEFLFQLTFSTFSYFNTLYVVSTFKNNTRNMHKEALHMDFIKSQLRRLIIFQS